MRIALLAFIALSASSAAWSSYKCTGPVLMECEMSQCVPLIEGESVRPQLTVSFDTSGSYTLCRNEECSSDKGDVAQQSGALTIHKETFDPETHEKTAFIALVLDTDVNKAVLQTHQLLAELECKR